MSHDGDRVNLYRYFFLEQLSSLKIHERLMNKETDICFVRMSVSCLVFVL